LLLTIARSFLALKNQKRKASGHIYNTASQEVIITTFNPAQSEEF
jgi:hypothetical protein